MTAEIKKSPAMMAVDRFASLCRLEDKANASYLVKDEREARAWLRESIRQYLDSLVKGEAAAARTEEKVPA